MDLVATGLSVARGLPVYADVTIVSPLSLLGNPAPSPVPGSAIRQAELRKCRVYHDVVQSREASFFPLAADSFGRWGPYAQRLLSRLAAQPLARGPASLSSSRQLSRLRRWWGILSLTTQRALAECLLAAPRQRPEVTPPLLPPPPPVGEEVAGTPPPAGVIFPYLAAEVEEATGEGAWDELGDEFSQGGQGGLEMGIGLRGEGEVEGEVESGVHMDGDTEELDSEAWMVGEGGGRREEGRDFSEGGGNVGGEGLSLEGVGREEGSFPGDGMEAGGIGDEMEMMMGMDGGGERARAFPGRGGGNTPGSRPSPARRSRRGGDR